MSLAGPPLDLGAQQVLLRHHLQDGTDVLGQAAMDEDQALLQQPPGLGRCVLRTEDAVGRHEPAAADAELRIALAGQDAGDELHSRPDASRVLPASAGASQPLAEERPGEDETPLLLEQRALDGAGLTRGAHAGRHQGSEERGGDGEARALGNPVHRAHELEPEAGPDHPRQQVGQALSRPLDAGRDDARGDDRGLQQAEVVLGEVEDLGEARHVGRGPEIDAGQAEDRFLDDAEVGLHRRARDVVAAVDAEVHRDVQDLRPLGVVHAEEEDVAPAAVGEVHPDRGPLAQDRVGARRRSSPGAPSSMRSGWSAG